MYPTEYGMIIAVWYRRVVGGLLLRLGPDTSCGVYDGRGCASQYVSGLGYDRWGRAQAHCTHRTPRHTATGHRYARGQQR